MTKSQKIASRNIKSQKQEVILGDSQKHKGQRQNVKTSKVKGTKSQMGRSQNVLKKNEKSRNT